MAGSFGNGFHHFHALFVPSDARQEALFRPAPITIHDNGDMLWDPRGIEFWQVLFCQQGDASLYGDTYSLIVAEKAHRL
jgi:hypothetical protein